MTSAEYEALLRQIGEYQRCKRADEVALRTAQQEVRRFEQAIALDEQSIKDVHRRIDEHWERIGSAAEGAA